MSMIQSLAMAMGKMLPPLTAEQITQIKNPKQRETRLWLHVIERFYGSLPADYKDFLTRTALYVAVGLENDDGMRGNFAKIINDIHTYANDAETEATDIKDAEVTNVDVLPEKSDT